MLKDMLKVMLSYELVKVIFFKGPIIEIWKTIVWTTNFLIETYPNFERFRFKFTLGYHISI